MKKFILPVFFILMTGGCFGARETDEIAYVLAVGFDQGQENILSLTVQVANPVGISGGEGGGGGGSGQQGGGGSAQAALIFTVEAPTLFGGIDLLESVIDRQVSLVHAKAIIFSEELARKGLNNYVNALRRYREIRGTMMLFISKGKAADFMEKNQSIMEINPSRQYELIQRSGAITGMLPGNLWFDFYNEVKIRSKHAISNYVDINKKAEKELKKIKQEESGSGGQGPQNEKDAAGQQSPPPKNEDTGKEEKKEPKPKSEGDYKAGTIDRKGPNPADFLGTAVFRQDKMVGILDGNETRILLMLRGEFRTTLFSLEDPRDPKKMIVVDLRQSRAPLINVFINKDHPRIDAEIFLEFNYLSLQSNEDYITPSKYKIIEKAVEQFFEREAKNLLAKSKKWKSDFIGFGNYASIRFWTWEQWEKYNWSKVYEKAKINVKVNARFRRTGIIKRLSGVGG